MGRLVIDGNQVYEIDEECMRKKEMRQIERMGRRQAGGRTVTEKNGQKYSGRRNG